MMSIRYEGRLDGVSNYLPWKVRITVELKEWKIWKFANTTITKSTDKDELEEHEMLEARAQRVILDGVKDHLIPHLAEKKTAKDMWDTLNQLFEAKIENKKMALRDKLHNIKLTKDDNVTSYLTRVAQVKYELVELGEIILGSKLSQIELKGFSNERDVFVKCIVGREKLPSWSRLRDYFTHEEIQEGSRND